MKGRVPQSAALPGSEPRPAADAPVPDAPTGDLEPAAPEPAAAPAAAAPPEPTPPADPPRPTPPEDPREAIGKRARARRDAEIAEAAQDPQVKVLDSYAGAAAPAEPAPSSTTAQPDDTATPKAPAAQDAPGSGADPNAPGIKIQVYGEEVVVSEDEVYAAGIATLQKERGAEYRMQQAAQTETQLRKYHRELDAYRDRLQSMERDVRAGRPPSAKDVAAAAAPPQQGATATVDDAKLAESARKAAEVIYRGDPGETAKALQALLADVAQGRTATPPPVDLNAVAEAAAVIVDRRTETRTVEERRKAVNTTFATEFQAVVEHPEAFAIAQTRYDALLADPANAGKPWEDLAREAGKAALHRYPELKAAPAGAPSNVPGQPPAPTVDKTLEQRRTLKSKTVVRQPTTGARAPAPQPQPVRSNKQYIADMRASRGLPSAG